jgi:hypothetical protein
MASASTFAKVSEEARDFEFQTRQFLLDDIPDEEKIHAPIAMNEAISEGHDPLPDSDGRIACRRRQAVGSLADDLEMRMTASWTIRSRKKVSRPSAT